MDTPPPPFETLAHWAEDDSSLDRVKTISQALQAIPALQTWLRELRRQDVLALKQAGTTYTAIAREIGVEPDRVSKIARGIT
jgi:predicted transcriptional regulator